MLQNNFHASLRRTNKVDVDDVNHFLPPDLGPLGEEFRVSDYSCPQEWDADGIFLPVKEGDAFWLDFRRPDDYSDINWDCAALCSVQKVNPTTGEQIDLSKGLCRNPQNYLRLPEQLWLDGFVNNGKVYQFVVTKAGIGLAVNEHVLPVYEQNSHSLAFAFFRAKNMKALPQKPEIRWTQNRVDNTNGPMWFSPLNTPQNWNISSWSKLDKSAYCLASKELRTSGGSIKLSSDEKERVIAQALSTEEGRKALVECEGPIRRSFEYTPECFYTMAPDTIITHHHIDINDFDKASIGAGGRIDQLITKDNNTVDYYEEKPSATLRIYLALPDIFDEIMKAGKKEKAEKDENPLFGKINGTRVPLTI